MQVVTASSPTRVLHPAFAIGRNGLKPPALLVRTLDNPLPSACLSFAPRCSRAVLASLIKGVQ